MLSTYYLYLYLSRFTFLRTCVTVLGMGYRPLGRDQEELWCACQVTVFVVSTMSRSLEEWQPAVPYKTVTETLFMGQSIYCIIQLKRSLL